MATVFLRTFIMFALLFGAIRLMGKRQVGELEISELVITFMLSELAVMPISDKNIPLLYSVIPILILLSVEVILSFIISKSSTVKKLLLGRPSVIINKGKLDQKELQRLRMSATELMSELRLKGISSVYDVDYAIVEDNGQLSVFTKKSVSPLTPEDAGIIIRDTGMSHCVVIEGKIYEENLKLTGKSEKWVETAAEDNGASVDDIFLMTVDDCDNVYIIRKEDK